MRRILFLLLVLLIPGIVNAMQIVSVNCYVQEQVDSSGNIVTVPTRSCGSSLYQGDVVTVEATIRNDESITRDVRVGISAKSFFDEWCDETCYWGIYGRTACDFDMWPGVLPPLPSGITALETPVDGVAYPRIRMTPGSQAVFTTKIILEPSVFRGRGGSDTLQVAVTVWEDKCPSIDVFAGSFLNALVSQTYGFGSIFSRSVPDYYPSHNQLLQIRILNSTPIKVGDVVQVQYTVKNPEYTGSKTTDIQLWAGVNALYPPPDFSQSKCGPTTSPACSSDDIFSISALQSVTRTRTFSFSTAVYSPGQLIDFLVYNGTTGDTRLIRNAFVLGGAAACTRNVPQIISSAPSLTLTPSEDGYLTITVRNQDSGGCPPSDIRVTTSCTGSPSFCHIWPDAVQSKVFNLNPGQSASFQVRINYPTTGSYSLTITAENLATAMSSTLNIPITVQTACTTNPPQWSPSSTTLSTLVGQPISTTSTLTNMDSSTCAPRTFTITSNCASGVACNVNPSSVTLNPGQTQTITFTLTPSSAGTTTNTFSTAGSTFTVTLNSILPTPGFGESKISSVQLDAECHMFGENKRCSFETYFPSSPTIQLHKLFARDTVSTAKIAWTNGASFELSGCNGTISVPGTYKCSVAEFLLVGLTIGNISSNGIINPPFCNEDCYVGVPLTIRAGRDFQNMHRWADIYVAPATGISGTTEIGFNFKSSVFNLENFGYGIAVALWKVRMTNVTFRVLSIVNAEQKLFRVTDVDGSITDFLCPTTSVVTSFCPLTRSSTVDWLYSTNSIYITPKNSLPPYDRGILASVELTTVSDRRPALNDIIDIHIKVKNTGRTKISGYVGLTIQQGANKCNRDCYVDGLGDWGFVVNLEPQHETVVKRTMKIDSRYFSPGNADVLISITHQLPAITYIDFVTVPNHLTILSEVDKYPVVATGLKVTKQFARTGEVLEFTPFIHNRGNKTLQVYVGISLGKFDALPDTIYTDLRSPIEIGGIPMAPCNSKCIRDSKPTLIPLVVEAGSIETVTRKLIIPEYLSLANSTDVQVAIFKSAKEVKVSEFKSVSEVPREHILSVVYFKDAINITKQPGIQDFTSTFISALTNPVEEGISRAFGMEPDSPGARFTAWFLMGIISLGTVFMVLTRMGVNVSDRFLRGDSAIIAIIIIFLVSWLVAGAFIGKVPVWMIVLIILLLVLFSVWRYIKDILR